MPACVRSCLRACVYMRARVRMCERVVNVCVYVYWCVSACGVCVCVCVCVRACVVCMCGNIYEGNIGFPLSRSIFVSICDVVRIARAN